MSIAASIGGVVWGLLFSRIAFILLANPPKDEAFSLLYVKLLTVFLLLLLFVSFLGYTVPRSRALAEAHWQLYNQDLTPHLRFQFRTQIALDAVKAGGSYVASVFLLFLGPHVINTAGQVNFYHTGLLAILFLLILAESMRTRSQELDREALNGQL